LPPMFVYLTLRKSWVGGREGESSECYTYMLLYMHTCTVHTLYTGASLILPVYSGVCNKYYERLVCWLSIVLSDLHKQCSASRQTAPHSSDISIFFTFMYTQSTVH
jgi:hypothetical protein